MNWKFIGWLALAIWTANNVTIARTLVNLPSQILGQGASGGGLLNGILGGGSSSMTD